MTADIRYDEVPPFLASSSAAFRYVRKHLDGPDTGDAAADKEWITDRAYEYSDFAESAYRAGEITVYRAVHVEIRKGKGVVGALKCRTVPEGLEFKVGTGLTDDERKDPPKVGAKITYKYTEKSDKGIPKYASFVCVRDYE